MKRQKDSVPCRSGTQRKQRRALKDFKVSTKRYSQIQHRDRRQVTRPWDVDLQDLNSDCFVISDTGLDYEGDDVVDLTSNGEGVLENDDAVGNFRDLTASSRSKDVISPLYAEHHNVELSPSVGEHSMRLQSLHRYSTAVKDPQDHLTLGANCEPKPPAGAHLDSPVGSSNLMDFELDNPNDSCSSCGSAASGPSTPSGWSSVVCRECKRLFTRMRRQAHRKRKARDDDPASLSCDQWMLTKPWRPRRLKNAKGRLWIHLRRIRKEAVKLSKMGVTNSRWTFCSRPHVFLQRNLVYCKQMALKLNVLVWDKARGVKAGTSRTQQAANVWPPVNARVKRNQRRERQFKEKEKLGTNNKVDDTEFFTRNICQYESLHQHDNVFNDPKRKDGVYNKHDLPACHKMKRTCRVLQFDDLPEMATPETTECNKALQTSNVAKGIPKSITPAPSRNKKTLDLLVEDLDEFRTPVDLSSSKSERVMEVREPVQSSKEARCEMQKGGFRSMLAALEMNQSRVIREFDPLIGSP